MLSLFYSANLYQVSSLCQALGQEPREMLGRMIQVRSLPWKNSQRVEPMLITPQESV